MFNSLKKKTIYFFILLAIICCGLFLKATSPEENVTQRKLVIYSDINTNFFDALTTAFTKEKKIDINIHRLKELNGKDIQADLVLSNSMVLNELQDAGALETLELPLANPSNNWLDIFYDPVVLVINREYARKYGQVHLTRWQDLVLPSKAKIAIENFNSSNIQNEILACFASNMGENNCLKYFSHLNKFVVRYSKFPFSPVRLITSGEANFAITLCSNLYEFSDNDFPAYFIEPEEGTPAIIYGAGIFKGSDSREEAQAFIEWLSTSSSARNIALQEETGYKFLHQTNKKLDKQNLWLNVSYKNEKDIKRLVLKWYDKVRFGTYNEK